MLSADQNRGVARRQHEGFAGTQVTLVEQCPRERFVDGEMHRPPGLQRQWLNDQHRQRDEPAVTGGGGERTQIAVAIGEGRTGRLC